MEPLRMLFGTRYMYIESLANFETRLVTSVVIDFKLHVVLSDTVDMIRHHAKAETFSFRMVN